MSLNCIPILSIWLDLLTVHVAIWIKCQTHQVIDHEISYNVASKVLEINVIAEPLRLT